MNITDQTRVVGRAWAAPVSKFASLRSQQRIVHLLQCPVTIPKIFFIRAPETHPVLKDCFTAKETLDCDCREEVK